MAFRIDMSNGDWGNSYVNSLKSSVLNRACDKLQSRLSDTASTLTALVESQSTINMVTKRLLSFAKFKRAFELKRYKAAIREVLMAQRFRSKRKESKRRQRLMRLYRQPPAYWKSKTIANAWLETWFGWLPTVGDVQKGVQVLSRDLPDEYVRVKSALPFSVRHDNTFGTVSAHAGLFFASASCVIQVTNPNLFLASQLGLTNPVLTAVETLPWSWLLGWFVNLDQFFRQFSVFHGVTVSRACNTVGVRDEMSFDWYTFGPYQLYTQGAQSCYSFQRSLGLPSVTLQWKGLTRLSVTRAATLSSLLVGRLPRD